MTIILCMPNCLLLEPGLKKCNAFLWHKIYMIKPLIVVNSLQVHATHVLGLISTLQVLSMCSHLECHQSQHNENFFFKSKICEIANCNSPPHFTASFPRLLSAYKMWMFWGNIEVLKGFKNDRFLGFKHSLHNWIGKCCNVLDVRYQKEGA